ncbi:DUF262 domain-containing protein [Methylorubrum extorquens]|uniref:DUF262 domain-containing protein n=1 Tax=Methylorubrum extorquens TaxID=408 RepID=UPI00031285D8|nr:DUF262 domain-containing protein [Methylorubrum extorquens]
MKITPNSLTLNQLLGSANEQFAVPAYQRRYSWRVRQIDELIDDIDLLDGSDVHLLGSIVCLTGHHTAGINKLELVDGQQRLTTLCIILECIRQKLALDNEIEHATELGRLLSCKAFGGSALPKIALDSIDGTEYQRLIDKDFDESSDVFVNQNLYDAFDHLRTWIEDLSIEQIGRFLYKLQNQALIIRLDVGDAKDAFKLFETINNRGLRLSPTDIIKNFVLGNAARFGNEQLEQARNSWALLIKFLDGSDSDAFFRYYLISKTERRITKAQVIFEFKALFMNQVEEAKTLPDRHLYADEEETSDEELDEVTAIDDVVLPVRDEARIPFKQFLSHVVKSAKVFGEIIHVSSGDKKIDRHLRNLRMIKSAQTYGLLMHLRVGGLDDKTFVEVLKLTESFVLRRHVCRERANETETLFAKLCGVDRSNPIDEIKRAYREASPSDERFKLDFASANFTSNIIDRARYCLEQLESKRHGKHVELEVLGAEEVHVEHIIPQKIKTNKSKAEYGDWETYLGDKVTLLHPRMVSRIGNLTLFAGALNIGASNNPFANKKKSYQQSSILITKELSDMPSFKFKHVEERSAELADLAVERWPIP